MVVCVCSHESDLVSIVLKVEAAPTATCARSETPQHIGEVDGVAIEGDGLTLGLRG